MNFKLYTLVDITNTDQYRFELGKEAAQWKEQNFRTVLQTLGLRANIHYTTRPDSIEVRGSLIGFNTKELIRVWRFDFNTERDHLYEKDGDPVGYLKDDFELVPYIQGLDELLRQNYAVFITNGPNRNIIFEVK